ncbi:helix-turn-helix domain-containing protein [Bradyrhizobium uaiense]|uniref:Helix-turn-helix domain-containing protein n=1 Tax=Bradyrhizobium uaiense TaxID=2594946 RepID=A0A6P1BIZ6_9BRAD|nr:helix-turn-helix domain-containing protein [Bradyrhizobium uaiense]NEU98328.1 helix-turn-helix domain-containing protein [Bradyrhizobium uaiense]
MSAPKIAILTYDGVNAFELGIAMEVFGLSNMGPNWYDVVVCSDKKHSARSSSCGVQIVTNRGLDALDKATTVIVPGWQDIDALPPKILLDRLEAAHARGARIATICAGVFVLAATGLLSGRRAAVHWAQAEALAQKYPDILVDSSVLYVDDNDILSSAGRAAGLDLCIHIVERDFGARVANEVARRLVVPARREGGQAQYIPRKVLPVRNAMGGLLVWIRQNLDEDLAIEKLAERVRMSRRTFIRRFIEATGTSPGEWITQERMTHARMLLEDTRTPVEQVAAMSGFGSVDTLRHHFRAHLATSPVRYRTCFRKAVPEKRRRH